MSLRLFVESPLSAGLEFALPEDAARHVQVRRLQPGDDLRLFDGAGGEWRAQVTRMGKRDVDVRIDGRANDIVPPERFQGFHRVEQSLWSDSGAPTGRPVTAVAAALVGDVHRLRGLASRTHFTVLQLTSGATELLDEIEANKITGGEERYSHLDLLDIAANVAGVDEVVQVLRPYLLRHAATLLHTIERRSAQLATALHRFAAQPGYDGSGYVRFSTVPAAQRRRLAADVQALAEPVALLTAATSR